MNAQHSSESGEWYTPEKWIRIVRRVLCGIDLDPCSSQAANGIVKARVFFSARDNALTRPWSRRSGTGFVNPPGACEPGLLSKYRGCGKNVRCSCALPKRFLAKSLDEARAGMSIVYLAYSVNQVRHLANADRSGLRVAVAFPGDRIPYIDPKTMQPQKGTNCDSAFFCLSQRPEVLERFRSEFRAAGCMILENK